jgi:hypothetical protein
LLKFFLSTAEEIEIPYNISNRDERNHFFACQLPQLEREFTLFWSTHLSKFGFENQCCKAIAIDGIQKPDRFVYHLKQELIHSEELGKIL